MSLRPTFLLLVSPCLIWHLAAPTALGQSPAPDAEPTYSADDPNARELLVPLVAGAGLVFLAWLAFRPRYAFVVSIRRGVPRVTRGAVAAPLLGEIADLCAHNRIDRGTIYGVRVQHGFRLLFSSEIPPECCQRLRNLWTLHR